jgi:hypothetical protein
LFSYGLLRSTGAFSAAVVSAISSCKENNGLSDAAGPYLASKGGIERFEETARKLMVCVPEMSTEGGGGGRGGDDALAVVEDAHVGEVRDSPPLGTQSSNRSSHRIEACVCKRRMGG